MKNAFVLAHHHGDDGTVSEGMILRDVATKRFDELEKRGLVREATPQEAEEGYKPEIEADPTKGADGDDETGDKDAPEHANKRAPRHGTKAA